MSLAPSPPRAPAAEPPLRHGDRMDFDPFARRWENTPGIRRAELVNGAVRIDMAPVRAEPHGWVKNKLGAVFAIYEMNTPYTFAANNSTVRLGNFSGPQADVFLMVLPQAGGQARLAGGYALGPVELVAEVSASTAAYDLSEKLDMYRAHGIDEYIVFRTEERLFDWFRLQAGPAERIAPDAAGVARSIVHPGLWINVPALLANRRGPLQRAINAGLASPEHAEFVRKLLARGGDPGEW